MLDLLPLWMIAALMVLLFSGYPVALVLVAVTMLFTTIAILTDLMSSAQLQIFALRAYGLLADNLIFPAVPPLILMGVALARGGQVHLMLRTLARALRHMPGHLPITVLLIGVILAPSAGLIGAAVSMLAVATLPVLLEAGYDAALASAAVAASGTLGVILPPAVMLFFLADLMGAPIIGMFTGVLLPAAALLTLYGAWFAWRGRASRQVAHRSEPEASARLAWLHALGPAAVVLAVLAAIASGWATPSQSGSLGALAAFLLMLTATGWNWRVARDVCVETAHVTAMVFLIIIAANAFSFVFRALDGDGMVVRFFEFLHLGNWGTLLFILGLIFTLGFFIDWLEIVLITLPIFTPMMDKLDFSQHVGAPVLTKTWIGVCIALVLQTSFLTPPFGFALFFLRGSAPPGVRMADIYRGIVPIVLIQLLVIAVVLTLPWLAISLPRLAIR
jgi:tripartite ATP-independent transporter DctM subunit